MPYHNSIDKIVFFGERDEEGWSMQYFHTSWWRHQMETFSALLSICGPRWIPHTKASDAELWYFFYLRLNKRLSKQSWGWWLETLSHPLWRQCDDTRAKSGGRFQDAILRLQEIPMRRQNCRKLNYVDMIRYYWHGYVMTSRHRKRTYFRPFVRGIHPALVDSPHKGPVMRNLSVYFVVTLNKILLSKRSIFWWVSTIIFRLLFCCMPKWLND